MGLSTALSQYKNILSISFKAKFTQMTFVQVGKEAAEKEVNVLVLYYTILEKRCLELPIYKLIKI